VSTGCSNTADDQTLTFLGIPRSALSQFPATTVIQNVDRYGRFRTIEATVTKRHSNRFSFVVGGSHTWSTSFPFNAPNTPNSPGALDFTRWDLKASGTYDGPWGLKFSPVLRHQAGSNSAGCSR
jgi:hypothetical protein